MLSCLWDLCRGAALSPRLYQELHFPESLPHISHLELVQSDNVPDVGGEGKAAASIFFPSCDWWEEVRDWGRGGNGFQLSSRFPALGPALLLKCCFCCPTVILGPPHTVGCQLSEVVTWESQQPSTAFHATAVRSRAHPAVRPAYLPSRSLRSFTWARADEWPFADSSAPLFWPLFIHIFPQVYKLWFSY